MSFYQTEGNIVVKFTIKLKDFDNTTKLLVILISTSYHHLKGQVFYILFQFELQRQLVIVLFLLCYYLE